MISQGLTFCVNHFSYLRKWLSYPFWNSLIHYFGRLTFFPFWNSKFDYLKELLPCLYKMETPSYDKRACSMWQWEKLHVILDIFSMSQSYCHALFEIIKITILEGFLSFLYEIVNFTIFESFLPCLHKIATLGYEKWASTMCRWEDLHVIHIFPILESDCHDLSGIGKIAILEGFLSCNCTILEIFFPCLHKIVTSGYEKWGCAMWRWENLHVIPFLFRFHKGHFWWPMQLWNWCCLFHCTLGNVPTVILITKSITILWILNKKGLMALCYHWELFICYLELENYLYAILN